jgi:hypothetical protein
LYTEEMPFDPPVPPWSGVAAVSQVHLHAVERHIKFVCGDHDPGGGCSCPLLILPILIENGTVGMDLEEGIHGREIEFGIIRERSLRSRGELPAGDGGRRKKRRERRWPSGTGDG